MAALAEQGLTEAQWKTRGDIPLRTLAAWRVDMQERARAMPDPSSDGPTPTRDLLAGHYAEG